MNSVRELFSTRRPIDRPIEKVIDYAAVDEKKVRAEIDEYEVTDHIESRFKKLLELYADGVQGRGSGECGVWVSGFYGSGKSSFTKYLGLALDDERVIDGRRFSELLAERLQSSTVKGLLNSLVSQSPTAVVMLDLATEQIATDTGATVTNVLWWKILQRFGYSREKKLCWLELELDKRGLRARFDELYEERFKSPWADIHNDEMIGVANAAQIVPEVLPAEFPTPESFSELASDKVETVRDVGSRMIDIVREKSGKENILFLIDEAGQYVAPRSNLILNLDGLARSLKESGKGKVWIVGTGQQTLTEIVEKAALNSAELNKLKDRFPISIELEAQDIKEITYRRLLTKSESGEGVLREKFSAHGQALITHTRVSGSKLFKGDPDADSFVRLYPFLPVHFDLLLELIRSLARSTGGIGLRSAIRVIQDVLVDVGNLLPAGATPVADRGVGALACADDIYNTLRTDIAKGSPHVVDGVNRVLTMFSDDTLKIRVAKAVAVLQTLDDFPKTAANIAALLYPELGAPSLLGDVRTALAELCAESECGLAEDARAGGFVFLSDSVRPFIEKRNSYVPTAGELSRLRNQVLRDVFDPAPSVRLENVKDIKACMRVGKVFVAGDEGGVEVRLELTAPVDLSSRREALQIETNASAELKNSIVWLISVPDELDDHLVRASRSLWASRLEDETQADKEIAQFIRGERSAANAALADARRSLEAALGDGSFYFRGVSRSVAEAGKDTMAAVRGELQRAAAQIYEHLKLVPIRPNTDLASKFLEVTDLGKMPTDRDPLQLVVVKGGNHKVDADHPALAEAMRAFEKRLDDTGGAGRLLGSVVQDMFLAAPYGWTKDATRYLFAALLAAKEVQFHTADGVVRGPGPKASEAVKSTMSFAKVGVSRSEGGPSQEALVRAAERLRDMVGMQVLPLEDSIAVAVRDHVAPLVVDLAGLPAQLGALDLPGAERAGEIVLTLNQLVQFDESGMSAMLADDQSAISTDVKWIRGMVKTLDEPAIADLKAAKGLLRDLTTVRQLFPVQVDQLVDAERVARLRDDLGSPSFFERVGSIRGDSKEIRKQVRVGYAAKHPDFIKAIERALERIQAEPGWALLDADEQQAYAADLAPEGMPAEAGEGTEVGDIQRLLVAISGVAAVEAQILRKLPQRPIEETGDSVEVVAAGTLAPDSLLETDEDVEDWLGKLRARFVTVIKAGKSIRIIGG